MGLRRQRYVLVMLDALLLSVAYLGAFALRLDLAGFAQRLDTVLATLPLVLAISLFVHLRFGLFNAILRYASLETAVAVAQAVLLSVALSCLAVFLVFRLEGVPRGVFVIYAMAALLLVGGARVAVRMSNDRRARPRRGVRVVLWGAGDTAELALRGLRGEPELGYRAVGILDEDPRHRGKEIHRVRIFGGLEALDGVLALGAVEELWVCIPGLVGEPLRRIYEAAAERGLRVKVLPRLRHALLGADLGRFHEPEIGDLLRRPPRALDPDGMREWIRGRRVLITGAGGSIGSELSRQVAELEPACLALCDACEENLFEVHRALLPRLGVSLERPWLIDIREASGVTRMIRETRPDVIFHVAAYKHVPLVETNPCEGVLTNVLGLCHVAVAAVELGVEDFVFISTDKAVRPVNVMGATKRLGEIVTQVLDRESATRFSAVRFGNVLGSSGSVVPIFQEQIRRGGPVTVTHPDMTRYFMLVSEAVELVIQAGAIGNGGEVFILDMGEPVRIADMARDLIRLMGKEPETEIAIEYVGVRPGEKIFEELLIDGEDARTPFHDIWIDGGAPPQVSWTALSGRLRALFDAARDGQEDATRRSLAELVPEYSPPSETVGQPASRHCDVDLPERTRAPSRATARPRVAGAGAPSGPAGGT